MPKPTMGKAVIARSRLRGNEGFTLVELMVAVLLIAILIGIAMQTLAGARTRAHERRAQTHARNSLIAAKGLYDAREDYTIVTVTELQEAEHSLTFVDGGTSSSNDRTLSVASPNADTFIIAVYSQSGRCMWVKDSAVPTTGGTRYAITTSVGNDCKASSPPPDASFLQSWNA